MTNKTTDKNCAEIKRWHCAPYGVCYESGFKNTRCRGICVSNGREMSKGKRQCYWDPPTRTKRELKRIEDGLKECKKCGGARFGMIICRCEGDQ